MKIIDEYLKIVEKIRNFSFEHGYSCELCGGELFDYPEHRICNACEQGFPYNDGLTCPKCGRETVSNGVCLLCKSTLPDFDEGASAFTYASHSASAINRLKNGNRRILPYLGECITKTLLEHFPELEMQFGRGRYEINEKKLLIVPVPLSKKSRKLRGFNQAEELAKRLLLHLTEEGFAVEMDSTSLIKNKETPLQKELTGMERRKNTFGSFHLQKRTVFKDRIVVLVDDIMTTGATGSACAKLLKGAGAKLVYFLTVCSSSEKK